ncbi:hypothetical protein [Trichoplusia ni ascovirus 6b]|nr:hypothetical protein [Trichoplusia ni ascovirus 6b]
MIIPHEKSPCVLAYIRVNVGYKLIRAITDMIAAGAPIAKSTTSTTNSNGGNGNSVRRLHFAFSPNKLRFTGNSSVDRDTSISAVIDNPTVFSKYILNWGNELMVGVPMDAFRKAFGGSTESSTCTTVQYDPIDIIVTTGSTDHHDDNHDNEEHMRPRSIIFYNPKTNSGCETSCMLVSNVIDDGYDRAIKLLTIQPVDLVSLHAELGGVESCFSLSLNNRKLCVSNNMGSATKKWRIFSCDETVDPNFTFTLRIRSNVIHSIQKLKTITNEITVYKKVKRPLRTSTPYIECEDNCDIDMLGFDDDDEENCDNYDGIIIRANLGPSTGSTRSKLKHKRSIPKVTSSTSEDIHSSNGNSSGGDVYGELIIHLSNSDTVIRN